MRVTIAAVGRLREAPLRALFDDYAGRSAWPIQVKEVEEKRKLAAAERMESEARLLAASLPDKATLIVLDQRGKVLSSEEFASQLGRFRDEGLSDLGFVIGGADGLTSDWRKKARLVLSFGAMTWPHLLVRVMLAEQLYRAQSILAGHPYHRA